jgi:hypothetical protein
MPWRLRVLCGLSSAVSLAGVTLIPVDSHAIRAVGYEGTTLAVLFHTSDTVYLHSKAPLAVYLGLIRASSIGAFYNRYIRGKYK